MDQFRAARWRGRQELVCCCIVVRVDFRRDDRETAGKVLTWSIRGMGLNLTRETFLGNLIDKSLDTAERICENTLERKSINYVIVILCLIYLVLFH